MSAESLDLEPSKGEFVPRQDKRPHMPEPPPVRLVAVEDVHAPAGLGQSPELDEFYVGLLRFEREPAEAALVYRAENVRLHFDVQERPIEREEFRPIQIEVPSLAQTEAGIIEREFEYERQRGLSVAQDQLVLRDPAGNWVAISEMRRMM